jgi:hypothetical protein
MKLLLIDVAKDHFKWAIKQDGQVTLRGLAHTFEELRAIETRHQGNEVWIDEGFRTDEVRAAASLWKWNSVKGPSLMHDEIEVAFRHDPTHQPMTPAPFTLSEPSDRPEPAAGAAGNPPSGASVGVAPEGVPNLSDNPYWHPLWKHMHHEYGLILLDDDCNQIARAVDESRAGVTHTEPT